MLKKLLTFRNFNHVLTLVVIFLAIYIMILPFWPSVTWWVQHDAPVLSRIATPAAVATNEVPQQNTLLIPSLGMREEILEGKSIYTVNNGVWHRPQSSTPDKGSNTVLVGHRFTYDGASVFYYLDKTEVGDKITVYWGGVRYTYDVFDISVVSPDRVDIEGPTDESILTLYTCTPLWSAKDRLVIRARLVETL